MSKLTKLLQYKTASNSKKQKLLSSYGFTKTFNENEKKLISSGADDYDQLLTREVKQAIGKGAEDRAHIRKYLPIFEISDYKWEVPADPNPGDCAPQLGEGMEYPTMNQEFTEGSGTIKKFGLKAAITNELLEDKKFSLIEYELNRLGGRLENSLNREGILQMLKQHSGTPSDVDPSSSALTREDIGSAMGKVAVRDWYPNTVFMNCKASGDLVNIVTDLNIDRNNVFGLDAEIICSEYDDGTYYWDDTDNSNHYFAIIFDSGHYASIGMRQDIETEEFDDPIRDLVNLKASMRFSVEVMNSDAACRILTV